MPSNLKNDDNRRHFSPPPTDPFLVAGGRRNPPVTGGRDAGPPEPGTELCAMIALDYYT
jgi:hypothetical protein